MQWWVAFSEVTRDLGLVLAGMVGVYLGWKRVTVANRQAEAQTRQAELTRRDHVAELFNRAVGQLRDASRSGSARFSRRRKSALIFPIRPTLSCNC